MPDYSIYVLDESDVTITGTSGGNGLDGVTQGDGSHLVGATITINTPNWTEIFVTDSDDPNFQDSDNSQTLNGPQEVDGVTYSGGQRVEAEYGFTVSYTDPGTGVTSTWQLIGFNVNEGGTSYATVEGIAVIGGPGGFPPAGVPLTVTSAQEGPNYAATSYATPICFAADTPVETGEGLTTMGEVAIGDRIRVADWRLVPVRWVGRSIFAADGAFAPVRIARGTLGTTQDIEVSQQHRILVTGWQAELMFGETEVLVPAIALVNDTSVRLRRGGRIEYIHVLFDGHELIETGGLVSESLHPGPMALEAVQGAARMELERLFPDLTHAERPLCRPALRRVEAQVLAADPVAVS
ncbi:Hint domain-containing protein [Pseudaestuariivita atlantica]|uniref:Hint domain-containing protein n=1 Tax=Pseudaestuariivita atlantica TaxID=1317121 RepID=UPI00067CFC3E|nr:Hint domain-containing protein [Pseudaestuariivita atlantica]